MNKWLKLALLALILVGVTGLSVGIVVYRFVTRVVEQSHMENRK